MCWNMEWRVEFRGSNSVGREVITLGGYGRFFEEVVFEGGFVRYENRIGSEDR